MSTSSRSRRGAARSPRNCARPSTPSRSCCRPGTRWAPSPASQACTGETVKIESNFVRTSRTWLVGLGRSPVRGRAWDCGDVLGLGPGGARPLSTPPRTSGRAPARVRPAQPAPLGGSPADQAAAGASPPVVTGDLNAEPGSDEVRLLGGLLTAPAVPGLMLIDAWRYADPADPGFTWDHRNGYQADSVIPDSRIDYVLDGLPRPGPGKVRSDALAGTRPH